MIIDYKMKDFIFLKQAAHEESLSSRYLQRQIVF